MTVYFSHRQIVCPGDLLAEGDYKCGRNVYREGNRFYASVLGLAELRESNEIFVIALRGFYFPEKDHRVIGIIVNASHNKWLVDINAPYLAVLPAKESKETLHIGDVIMAQIKSFTPGSRPVLTLISDKKTGRSVFRRGYLVRISPAKLPRLVGHRGSMIQVIEEKSKCKVVHGNNGFVYIEGEPYRVKVVMEAIQIIEREAHTTGLTDRISAFIEGRLREAEKAHN